VILALVISAQMLGRRAGPIAENIVGFLPIYLGLWAWLRWSSKRRFRSLGLEKQGALRKALRGALIATLMMAATAGLAIIPGASINRGAFGIGILSLLGYLVQGPAEEVLFRGWLLPVIGSRYRPWIGVVVSSLVFSLAHSGTHGITLLGFSNLFLFGAFASVYALAEGGLWGIGVWHAVWNWALGDVLGFAVDGSPHRGLLVSIHATGPDVISGGAFGLEGGLACTTVFLIAIGVTLAFTRRQAGSTETAS
jgi:membrane protease YdiL (CAAX protease family)